MELKEKSDFTFVFLSFPFCFPLLSLAKKKEILR